MAIMIGCTIKEAKQRLTIKEFEIWIRYRKKFGPMNPVRRYDAGAALIASVVARCNGIRNITAMDFMPFGKEEEEIEVDEDVFISALERTGRARYGR